MSRLRAVPRWFLAILTLIPFFIARSTRADVTSPDGIPAEAHRLPPAILVTFKPGTPQLDAFARAPIANRVALRGLYARVEKPGLSATQAHAELEQAVAMLGLSAVPDAGLRAARGHAVALESPFAEVRGFCAATERTYRVVLDASADAKAVARDLSQATEVVEAFEEPIGHFAGTPAARASASPIQIESWPPNDPLFTSLSQWGLRNTGTGEFGGLRGNDIRAATAWGYSTGNTSTIIGIVDTGVDPTHPDLDVILPDGSHRLNCYNAIPAYSDGADDIGHGTMVAGIAAAITNNGPLLDGRGVAGVCGGSGGDSVGCRIVSERVTDPATADAFLGDFEAGVAKAVLRGARVINVSLIFNFDPQSMAGAAQLALYMGAAAQHATLVCAAGNTADTTRCYPAAFAQFGLGVSVGALTADANLAPFSSRGPSIDVVAPGDNIWSTSLTYENAFGVPARNYVYSSGTSFAAPFVTGVAGLAASEQPSLIDNEFQYFARLTAHDLGDPGRDDTFGWGRIDAAGVTAALTPPRIFARGVAPAQTWSLVGRDTVDFVGSSLYRNGCVIEGRHVVDRWEVRAHVNLPYVSYEGPYVIVRTHGTQGYPNSKLLGFDLGGGELVPGTLSNQSFDVRTWVYNILDAPGYCSNQSPQGFVPCAPQDAQIAWSALAVMDTTATYVPCCVLPPPQFAMWRTVTPNPAGSTVAFRFMAGTTVAGARAFSVEILDMAGRAVRRVASTGAARGEQEAVWDLRDGTGRRVSDGVYFARIRAGDRTSATRRVVVIGRE